MNPEEQSRRTRDCDDMAQLRAAREQELAEVTLLVTNSDSDESEAVERRSATRLNPPARAETFVRRFG